MHILNNSVCFVPIVTNVFAVSWDYHVYGACTVAMLMRINYIVCFKILTNVTAPRAKTEDNARTDWNGSYASVQAFTPVYDAREVSIVRHSAPCHSGLLDRAVTPPWSKNNCRGFFSRWRRQRVSIASGRKTGVERRKIGRVIILAKCRLHDWYSR